MKKRLLKITALVIALGMIVGIGVFANSLVGNPVSKMLVNNTAKKHMEENYGDTDFYIERISYSFKDGNYYVTVKSPSSMDTEFSLCIEMDGSLKWDGYEGSVLSGQNTARRLYMEYRALVDTVLESTSFPYKSDIGFGDLFLVDREYAEHEEVPEYAIITETLELDKVYDIRKLGEQAGIITLYVQDEVVTVDRAAEVLLEFRRIMDEGGVPFRAIDFVLEYPGTEDGSRQEDRVETRKFLYEDIYEEGMGERVRNANKEAEDYYSEKDMENEKLLQGM